jgi:hypothetical protein
MFGRTVIAAVVASCFSVTLAGCGIGGTPQTAVARQTREFFQEACEPTQSVTLTIYFRHLAKESPAPISPGVLMNGGFDYKDEIHDPNLGRLCGIMQMLKYEQPVGYNIPHCCIGYAFMLDDGRRLDIYYSDDFSRFMTNGQFFKSNRAMNELLFGYLPRAAQNEIIVRSQQYKDLLPDQ